MIKPDVREDAINIAVTMANASQAEDGCIAYRFYADLEDPNSRCVTLHYFQAEDVIAAHGMTANCI